MPTDDLDDATADALLSGRSPVRREDRDDTVALDGLGDLVATIRNAGSARPRPHALLAEVLEHGVSALEPAPGSGVANVVAYATEDGSASRTGTGTAAPQAPGTDSAHREVVLPTAAGLRGRPRVRELVAAKLAALGFAAKFGAGSVAVLAATAGAGTVGALPGPVQEGFSPISALEAPATEQVDEAPPEGSGPERSDPERSGQRSGPASHADPGSRSTSEERPGVEGPEVAHEARSEDPGVDGPAIASQASNLRSEWGRRLAELARSAADERRPDHASARAGDASGSGGADDPGDAGSPRTTDNPGTADNPGTTDGPGGSDDPGSSGSPGTPGRSEGAGKDGHASEAPPEEQGSEEPEEGPDEEPDDHEGSEQPPEQAPGSDARP